MGSNLGEACGKGFTLLRLLWGRGAIHSFVVGDSTLFPIGSADGKKLWGRCFKGRRRRGGKFTCCLLWESKVEGGAIELAAWGTGCVVS